MQRIRIAHAPAKDTEFRDRRPAWRRHVRFGAAILLPALAAAGPTSGAPSGAPSATPSPPGAATIVFTEVMPQPEYDAARGETWSGNEYLELYNNGVVPVDLAGWRIGVPDGGATQELVAWCGPGRLGLPGTVLPAGGTAVLVCGGYLGAYSERIIAHAPLDRLLVLGVATTRFLGWGLRDGGAEVLLYRPDGTLLTSCAWDAEPGRGVSLERAPSGAGGAGGWTHDRSGGSPGWVNSAPELDLRPGNSLALSCKVIAIPAGRLWLRFRLAAGERATLRVCELGGRSVRTVVADAGGEGYHDVVWDGCDDGGTAARPGVYVVVLSRTGGTDGPVMERASCALVGGSR